MEIWLPLQTWKMAVKDFVAILENVSLVYRAGRRKRNGYAVILVTMQRIRQRDSKENLKYCARDIRGHLRPLAEQFCSFSLSPSVAKLYYMPVYTTNTSLGNKSLDYKWLIL